MINKQFKHKKLGWIAEKIIGENYYTIIERYDQRVGQVISNQLIEGSDDREEIKQNRIKDTSDVDWSGVIGLVQSMIDEIEAGTYHEDSDYKHYIYEAVIGAICNDGFYEWKNSK